MSEESQVEGFNHYITGAPKDREWFAKQWLIWPNRANPHNTTNISFLYGGVLAYLTVNECSPLMSPDLKSHVEYLHKLQDHSA